MTTYEVELKLRADHEPVRRRLRDRGADHLGRVEQTDTYYDAPDRNFAETDEALRIRRERSFPADDSDDAPNAMDTPSATNEEEASGEASNEASDKTSDEGSDETSDEGSDETSNEASDKTSDETTTRLTYKGPLIDTSSKTREEAETTIGDGETADRILRGLGYEPAATVSKRRDRFALGAYTVTLDRIDGLGEFVEIDREVTGDPEPAREEAKRLLRDLGLNPDENIQTSYLGLLLAEES